MNRKPEIHCEEEKIRQTIARSKEAFYECESALPLSHWEFLSLQSRYIKKRWWVLQGGLLTALLILLYLSESDFSIQRSLGVAAPAFVLLALPELWKNRNSSAMEVEGSTFYTLRQIYAARLTLFAGVDLTLLSLFFLGASYTGRITLWELMIQFLLPCNVTCCICFFCLYSAKHGSEGFSMLLSGIWTAAWELLLLNDSVYLTISSPLWCLLLALSIVFLGFSIWQGQRTWNRIWEVKPLWN
ncbi:hypothetical protein MR626_11760 [bacterium]|nr:hypothetical protein [bacterium]